MFSPSQADVRRFFCSVYAKALAGSTLEAIETIASQWMDEHPEYATDFADVDAALTSTAPALAFDLDTYRLLIKHLSGPGSKGPNLIRFAASPLQRARAEI